ncbi:hypothetical protein ARMGADRAFT_78368 [Armillaria gallica]|uniref:Mid2 domain-containing protein n=1 Tax=Armillaria gallica TaxID=47427 RepID=A0A2H3CF21_ARMGA|nr:hypothetical protein ARMGADRAFT_78368 [Armillaria gallica]
MFSPQPVLFHLILNMCILVPIIPMALSLKITLDSTPEAFQSIPISLHWEHNDPLDFVLGAFSNFPDIDSVMIVMANQVVENFTEDRIVDMAFNYTSPSRDDCTLVAWLQVPNAEPRNRFAESEPFTVKSIARTSTSITCELPIPTIVSGPTLSVSTGIPASTTASNDPFEPTSRTGMIVGSILGLFALGCMASVSIYVFIRQRRSKAATSLRPQDSLTRALLEEENARMRQEITALKNQIRCMEAGYGCSPPPSYRSASNYSSSNVSNSSRSFRV